MVDGGMYALAVKGVCLYAEVRWLMASAVHDESLSTELLKLL
jgi:hypothetical protein